MTQVLDQSKGGYRESAPRRYVGNLRSDTDEHTGPRKDMGLPGQISLKRGSIGKQ